VAIAKDSAAHRIPEGSIDALSLIADSLALAPKRSQR